MQNLHSVERQTESQIAEQTAASYANTERKPLLGKGSMHLQFPMICHAFLMPLAM